MTDALKPCPFCGSPDGIVMHEAARGIYHECKDGCGAYGPDADNGHWNDRPTERAAYLRGLEDAAPFLRKLAGTEWQEDEPGNRDTLPDEWQAYVEEMEAFANHWVQAAIRALAKEDRE